MQSIKYTEYHTYCICKTPGPYVASERFIFIPKVYVELTQNIALNIVIAYLALTKSLKPCISSQGNCISSPLLTALQYQT